MTRQNLKPPVLYHLALTMLVKVRKHPTIKLPTLLSSPRIFTALKAALTPRSRSTTVDTDTAKTLTASHLLHPIPAHLIAEATEPLKDLPIRDLPTRDLPTRDLPIPDLSHTRDQATRDNPDHSPADTDHAQATDVATAANGECKLYLFVN